MKFLGLEVSWGRPASVSAENWAPPPPPPTVPSKPEPTVFLGDLTRLELAPGDVCVVMCPGKVTTEAVERMRETWASAVGEAITLLVLDGGMRLGVLSPAQATLAAAQIADGRIVSVAVGE